MAAAAGVKQRGKTVRKVLMFKSEFLCACLNSLIKEKHLHIQTQIFWDDMTVTMLPVQRHSLHWAAVQTLKRWRSFRKLERDKTVVLYTATDACRGKLLEQYSFHQ